MERDKRICIPQKRWLKICEFIILNEKEIGDLLKKTLSPHMLYTEIWIENLKEGEMKLKSNVVFSDSDSNRAMAVSVSNLFLHELIYLKNKMRRIDLTEIITNIVTQVNIEIDEDKNLQFFFYSI